MRKFISKISLITLKVLSILSTIAFGIVGLVTSATWLILSFFIIVVLISGGKEGIDIKHITSISAIILLLTVLNWYFYYKFLIYTTKIFKIKN